VYGCSLKKLFYLNKTIQKLPVVYDGNTYLDGFVKDSKSLVIKTNDKYIMTFKPRVMKDLEINYENLKENYEYKPIKESDLKKLTIAYRISKHLWNKNKNKK